MNEGQYKGKIQNTGFAKKLLLEDGSVPTVRDPASSLRSDTGHGNNERESAHFITVHRSCFTDIKLTS